MSFTWPNLEFTGSEVESFISAYKELAESIVNDYENFNDPNLQLKGPYRSPQNIETYLEKALTYSSFIVKQRAGNVGLGTDFNIGSSPNPINLDQEDLIANLGCVFTSECMTQAFRNYINKLPNFSIDSSTLSPLTMDLLKFMSDGDSIKFSNTWGDLSLGSRNSFLGTLMQLYDAALGLQFELTGGALNPIISGHILASSALAKYLGSGGGQLTDGDIESKSPGIMSVVKGDIVSVLGDTRGVTSTGLNPVDFGGNSDDTVVQIDFGAGVKPILSYSLGTATVVLDPNGSPKILVDDYDFQYGWEVDRSGTGTIAGDIVTDSMIVPGVNRSDGNGNPRPNMTIHDAIAGSTQAPDINSQNFGNYIKAVLNTWVRYPAAASYGNGYHSTWSGHPNSDGSGKPFGIRLDLTPY
jgi:hypothetical protein